MKIKVLSAAFISTQNLRWRVWKTLDILRWFIGFTHLLLDKVQTQQTRFGYHLSGSHRKCFMATVCQDGLFSY